MLEWVLKTVEHREEVEKNIEKLQFITEISDFELISICWFTQFVNPITHLDFILAALSFFLFFFLIGGGC